MHNLICGTHDPEHFVIILVFMFIWGSHMSRGLLANGRCFITCSQDVFQDFKELIWRVLRRLSNSHSSTSASQISNSKNDQRGNMSGHWSGKRFFFNMTSNTQATKANVDKWDYIKLKSFWIAKETINRVKRQAENWGKIPIIPMHLTKDTFSEYITNSTKKIWFRKWVNDLNTHFSKEDIQTTNKYMKKCSTPLAIREINHKIPSHPS